jgi:hypothetical protein
VEETLTHY